MKKVVFVVPVYNEEKIIRNSILKLYNYFKKNINYNWKIVIVDNGSKDKTLEISNNLVKEFSRLEVIHIEKRGRGRALKDAWTRYSADVFGYCDVDLATDISYVKPLLNSILLEGSDLVVGNRYLKDSSSKRNLLRKFYSKTYLWLIGCFFRTDLTDFQCGFKAVNLRVVRNLVKKVRDDNWFFDSELLIRAEKQGYRIKEIPVNWTEMRVNDSRVRVFRVFIDYLRGLIRLKKELG